MFAWTPVPRWECEKTGPSAGIPTNEWLQEEPNTTSKPHTFPCLDLGNFGLQQDPRTLPSTTHLCAALCRLFPLVGGSLQCARCSTHHPRLSVTASLCLGTLQGQQRPWRSPGLSKAAPHRCSGMPSTELSASLYTQVVLCDRTCGSRGGGGCTQARLGALPLAPGHGCTPCAGATSTPPPPCILSLDWAVGLPTGLCDYVNLCFVPGDPQCCRNDPFSTNQSFPRPPSHSLLCH